MTRKDTTRPIRQDTKPLPAPHPTVYATALRELSQGEGLSVEALVMSPAAQKAFGSRLELDVYSAIRRAVRMIADPDHREALRNALAITGEGANLTERRTNYLMTVDISYRTLVRYEQAGADAAAQLLPEILDDEDQFKHLERRIDEVAALVLASLIITIDDGADEEDETFLDSIFEDKEDRLWVGDLLEMTMERVARRLANVSREATERVEADKQEDG